MVASICSSAASAANWTRFCSFTFLGPIAKNVVATRVVGPIFIRFRWKQVTCDLFLDESIKRFVIVERIDYIIAVPPGMRIRHVDFTASRFGISRHVQPVASPTFAKLILLKQAVNDKGHRPIRIFFPDAVEVFDLFWRRWQTDQIKTEPAEELCRPSASSAGFGIPDFSNSARMNRSTSVLGQAAVVHIWANSMLHRLSCKPKSSALAS